MLTCANQCLCFPLDALFNIIFKPIFFKELEHENPVTIQEEGCCSKPTSRLLNEFSNWLAVASAHPCPPAADVCRNRESYGLGSLPRSVFPFLAQPISPFLFQTLLHKLISELMLHQPSPVNSPFLLYRHLMCRMLFPL